MSTALYTLTSPLHKGLPEAIREPFLISIQQEFGENFIFKGEDFSSYGTYDSNIILVRTGGTEGIFRRLNLTGDIRLLTSGKQNSLAAAMEILAYVNKRGGRGEILHGEASYIAERLRSPLRISSHNAPWLQMMPQINFGGARLGIIGQPSDWLIASEVNYDKLRKEFGLKLVDISIEELVSLVRNAGCDLRGFEGSLAVYDALRKLVEKNKLNGLTIRCFDLLDSIGNTGCLALAKLNSEGIVSSCEGDIPALVTMMIAKQYTGCPGFQCNLSRIEGDDCLFAHCTVPLSMVSSYRYMTHFESGIGTAIKGEIPAGPATILKCSPDMECMAAIPAEIVRNQSEEGLCRTQIVVKAAGAAEYFLSSPLANHHIVVPGTFLFPAGSSTELSGSATNSPNPFSVPVPDSSLLRPASARVQRRQI